MKTNHSSLAAVCALALAVLPAAFAADANEEFVRIDTDNDGYLDYNEYTVSTARAFGQRDYDQDGRLAPAEASTPVLTVDGDNPSRSAPEALPRRDADRDGAVSAAEQFRISDQTFARKDADNDGKLSRDEYTSRR